LAQLRIDDRAQSDDKIRKLPGWDFAGRGSQAISKNLANAHNRQRLIGDGKKTLAACRWVRHRPNVQVSDISHVHQAEIEPRTAGHTFQQSLDNSNRRRKIGSKDWAEDPHGIDGRELDASPFILDKLPRGSFGNSLRLYVGIHAIAIDIGPRGLIEWRVLLGMAVANRGERGRQYDAAYVGVSCGAQHTESAFAGGYNQLVFMPRRFRRERRRHVDYIIASSNRSPPAVIFLQFDGNEREAICRIHARRSQHGEDLGFSVEVAKGGSHLVARG
jgi:hypothetical protein